MSDGARRSRLWLIGLSAALAIAYGIASPLLREPIELNIGLAVLKSSGIALLALIALRHRSRLLAAGLAFGAAGDFLLALDTRFSFMLGAVAFLIGHLFYIALFLRAGLGRAALRETWRTGAMAVVILAAIGITLILIPPHSTLGLPLKIYTGVLTAMVLASLTLPALRWLAIVGAVLFFVSDGFVAADMFHPINDPALAAARSFAGWMIYWAGQAAICVGAIGLHKRAPAPL